jgi:Mg/Co/Ni transporter MgtE
MDMSTPQFFEELSAWECLALLKKMELPFGSTLTVINNKHHVAGVVTLDVLLLSPDGKELGALMDSSITPLPAEMSLKVAKSSQDWHRHSVLPVRSAQGIYLGALSRATLSTVLQGSQQAGTTELLGDSMLAHLGTAMASSAAGLLALSSSSNVEAQKVAWPKPDAHKPSGQSATATETATEGAANGN